MAEIDDTYDETEAISDAEIEHAALAQEDFDAYLDQQARVWEEDEADYVTGRQSMTETELDQAESHEKLLDLIDRKGEYTGPDEVSLTTRTSREPTVPYAEKTIDVDGLKITGEFPVLDSRFDVDMPQEYRYASVARQEAYCNQQLRQDYLQHPEKYADLSPQQREDIEQGRKPTGFTWHHNEDVGEHLGGRMQLADAETHAHNKHLGGFAIHGASHR